MRITKTTQEKLQNILKAQNWNVRYEKGNFKGGYCIVHNQQTIIINKFHPLESKINTMIEIIRQLPVEAEKLSPDLQKLYQRLLKHAE